MGHLMGPPDGQQHMAGVQGPGGTGGAGGGADAPVIQQQEHGLPLNALKAEADVARQPVVPVPVEGAVGDGLQTGDELVPQGGDLGGMFR